MLHPHLPHPHVPHPHADFDAHPWLMVPFAFAGLFALAAVLIVVTFAVAKIVTGQAY